MSLRSSVDRVVGFRDSIRHRLVSSEQEVTCLETEEETLDLVSNMFRTLIDAEIVNSVKTVEQLQTEGLNTIFSDQDLEVKAEISLKHGKISLDVVTIQKHPNGTTTKGKSTLSFGGSVTTAQSVLMRIIVTLKRGLRPFFVLDESLAALEAEYATNMGNFLRGLCEKLGLDILIVTHIPSLFECAQTSYRIRRTTNGAKFDLVKKK